MSEQLLCRTCCKQQEPGCSIYVPVIACGQSGVAISEMIYEVSDILVTLDPFLPQQICPDCLVKLVAAHGFRQMVISSNTRLQREHLAGMPQEEGDG